MAGVRDGTCRYPDFHAPAQFFCATAPRPDGVLIARTIGTAANRAESNRFRQTYSSTVTGGLRPAARRRERRRRWSIEDPGYIDRTELTPLCNQARAVGAVKTRPNDEVAPRPAGGSAARLDCAAYGATRSALGAAVPAAGSGDMGGGGSCKRGPGSASTAREAAPPRCSGEDRVS